MPIVPQKAIPFTLGFDELRQELDLNPFKFKAKRPWRSTLPCWAGMQTESRTF